jgi:hypothetical protein
MTKTPEELMAMRFGGASVAENPKYAIDSGAAKGTDKPLDAHAWLDAAGVKVTGYPKAENFAEIACVV